MNTIAKQVTEFVTRTSHNHQLIQERGIRVKVFSGDLDRALTILQRKMQSSGMERLIKATPTNHIKNSEKKVLARKNLERRIKSIDFARKLQSILIKKVRDGASTSQTSPRQPPIPSRKSPKSQKVVPGILIKPRGRHRETPIHEPSHSVIPLPLSPEDRLPPRETPNTGKKPVLLSPEERLPPRKIQHSKTRPVLLSPEDSLPPRKTPNSTTRPLLLSPEDHHLHDHQPQQRPPPQRGGYGSTLPPIPKPSPWRKTGPTPSPHRRASGQRLPPAGETNAMTWSAAFCCAIFWVLLILAGLVVLIVYLIYRPRSPFVDISTANLNAAYLDMGFLLNGDLTILANFTNPNKKSSVEFSHVTFELYYYNTHIATQYINPFKIPKKMSMFASVHLVSSQVQLQPTQSRELQRQIENGPVLLNLRGTFHARSNLGPLFKYSYWLHTHCSFSLNSPPAGALRARRCSTKR